MRHLNQLILYEKSYYLSDIVYAILNVAAIFLQMDLAPWKIYIFLSFF